MRIVIDTSTLIRGLLRRHSEPAHIINKIVDGTYKLVMTDEMAKELVLAIFLSCGDTTNIKKYLRAAAVFILSAEKIVCSTKFTSCSDKDDKMFIECAIDGNVDICVSSDHSIFNIKSYSKNEKELELIKNINFFNPQDFYAYITQATRK